MEWKSSEALTLGQGEMLMIQGCGKCSLQHLIWRQQRIRRKKKISLREGGGWNRGASFSPHGAQGNSPVTQLIDQRLVLSKTDPTCLKAA